MSRLSESEPRKELTNVGWTSPRINFSIRQHALPISIALLLLIAGVVLYFRFQRYQMSDILSAATQQPSDMVITAMLLTTCSYMVLTIYDRLAMAYVRGGVPYRRVAQASLTSYAFCNTVGLSMLTGTMIRWNYYRESGMHIEQIPATVGFCIVTGWTSLVALTGFMMSIEPNTLSPGLNAPPDVLRLLGMGLLGVCAGYLYINRSHRTAFRFFGASVSALGWRIAAGQIVAGVVNWILVAAVVYVLLLHGVALPFIKVLAIFVAAQCVGWLSQVPGGLGAFEMTFILMLEPHVPGKSLPQVTASLLGYRAIYCFLPFAVMATMHTIRFGLARAFVTPRFKR